VIKTTLSVMVDFKIARARTGRKAAHP